MYQLIQGSSKNVCASHPAFFVQHESSFDLHFTTKAKTQDNQQAHSYYHLDFKEDFVCLLKDFGRPPFASIRQPLEIIRNLQDLSENAQQETKLLRIEAEAAVEMQKENEILRKAAEEAQQEIKLLQEVLLLRQEEEACCA